MIVRVRAPTGHSCHRIAPTPALHSIYGAMAFSANGTLQDHTYRIRLAGELDIGALPDAETAAAAAFEEVWERLVLDLEALEFMDSSGLRFIAGLHERCRSSDRALSIQPGPPAVQRVFEITGLDGLLPFER
jgi:anti-anti-sigma factor